MNCCCGFTRSMTAIETTSRLRISGGASVRTREFARLPGHCAPERISVDGHGRRVHVEAAERTVRVRAGAVGVVGPRRMDDAAVEAQARVVAVVDAVVGVGG